MSNIVSADGLSASIATAHVTGTCSTFACSQNSPALTHVHRAALPSTHVCYYLRPDQILSELNRFLQMLKIVYDTFGLTYKMALSTRPAERLGDDALWDQAEGALQGALDATGQDWEVSQSLNSSGIVGLFRN